jgi:hypothetical protein
MPIRHDNNGWWWDNKGPFDTKAKALLEARTSIANGYKEQIMDKTNVANFLSRLLHSATIAHIYHLQTKSFAQHKALGHFYKDVNELTDTLIEMIQGKYGIVEGYTLDAGTLSGIPLDYMIGLMHFIDNERIDMPQDSEIQNTIDEIAGLIDSTIYELRFLS